MINRLNLFLGIAFSLILSGFKAFSTIIMSYTSILCQTSDYLGLSIEFQLTESLARVVPQNSLMLKASKALPSAPWLLKVLPVSQTIHPSTLFQFQHQALLLHQYPLACFPRYCNHGTIEFPSQMGQTPVLYLLYQYQDGLTLFKTLQRLASTPFSIIHCLKKCINALCLIHEHDIAHLDLKPANILLSPPDTLILLDLGSARSPLLDPMVLKTDRYSGTPRYSAPEQLTNDNPGPPADIFAFGVILAEIITGKPMHSFKSRAKAANFYQTYQGSQLVIPSAGAYHYQTQSKVLGLTPSKLQLFHELSQQMMSIDPIDRPTAEILRDKFPF